MKTVWSRIVILSIFGTAYYAADKVLAQVEATVDATVKSNVRIIRQHSTDSWITWAVVDTWTSFWQALASWDLSLTKNLSGADQGNLHNY